MAEQDWHMVVVSPTGEWWEARDVRGDIDHPHTFRDDLIAIARRDTYRTGGPVADWLGEWEARIYDDVEHRKGCHSGGWGTAERVLRFHR